MRQASQNNIITSNNKITCTIYQYLLFNYFISVSKGRSITLFFIFASLNFYYTVTCFDGWFHL